MDVKNHPVPMERDPKTSTAGRGRNPRVQVRSHAMKRAAFVLALSGITLASQMR